MTAIHQHNLIHRDIKPANIWLEGPQARVKILDFGLVRLAHDDSHITQSGLIVGTPAFMSPEQARGEPVDGRSDLFSLGCVLYALCTGKEPFPGENTMARLTALALRDPPAIRDLNPGIPAKLVKLVMQLLDKDVDRRPASAQEVVDRVGAIEEALAAPVPVSQLGADTQRLKKTNSKTRRRKKARASRRRWWPVLVAACLLTGVMAVGGGILVRTLFASAPHPQAQSPTYLSELNPIAAVEWPEIPPPPGAPPPTHYNVLSVEGKRSLHGIGMHAARHGSASASYGLRKQFDVFSAEVSLNDSSQRSPVPLTFAVYGDGQLLWQSRPVVTRADTQKCTVSVKNVDVLQLRVMSDQPPGTPLFGAHGVWIEPAVSRQK